MKNRNSFGFVILYGFTATSLEGQQGFPLTDEQLVKIHNLLEELIDPVNYDNDVKECPDVQIMVNPSQSFEIFCDFYDENEQVIDSIIINELSIMKKKQTDKWLLDVINKGDNPMISIQGTKVLFAVKDGMIDPFDTRSYDEICLNTTKSFNEKYVGKPKKYEYTFG